MNITITQLEYIVAVDTHRNFAKAAEHCFITQPTLSMQIKKLEQQLGILIFDRSRKPVRPTTLGEKVIAQARISIQSLEKIQDIVSDSKGNIEGHLRVGIIPTVAPYLLPRFVNSLIKKYPKTQLFVEELLSSEILQRLSSDLLDIGIMVPPSGSGFTSIPLFREEFLLYFSASHRLKSKKKITVEELDTSDMWLLKEGHCFRDQVLSLCGKNQTNRVSRPIHFETGSLETLKNIIDHEMGFTLIPQLATDGWDAVDKKRLRRFKGEKPVREVCMVFHKSFMKERLLKVIQKEIVSSLPDSMLGSNSDRIVDWVQGSKNI